MTDRYGGFEELQAQEIENVDYRIIQRNGKWPVLIMAPHGGRIESYTSQISEWIAGEDFSLYIFENVKHDYAKELHITSHNFDEPLALEAVGRADLVLTVHGLRNSTNEFIMIGGLDVELGNDIKKALLKVGFTLEKSETKYSGQRPDNICNRGLRGKGVQLEITYALRKRIFEDSDYRQRFINAVRSTLFKRLEGGRNVMGTGELEEFEEKVFDELSIKAEKSSLINPELFSKYNVKRGLRDSDGKGVLVGLTEIGEVHSYILDENEMIPVPGRLIYRGIDISNIVDGFIGDDRYGFEETCYLLLFGNLPDKSSLKEFEQLLSLYQKLPEGFARDMILKAPSKDIMNVLARNVLALYSFDDDADDTSIKNVLKQCIRLIACFPSLAVYGYQAFSHYHGNQSLYIHSPRPDLGIAENILYMLRPDSRFTKLEATLLDLALVLHAEHGGGNNSSFVTHVVTSTGTDTYSVMAAALGALKGPRHGGANIKVVQMFEDMKQHLKDWNDCEEISDYLSKILKKEAFDKSGLIYGIGHAVYSISDPRSVIFKEYVAKLAKEKGLEDEFNLYLKVEKLAPEVMEKANKLHKRVSANVDFYSGFVYRMLGIPDEMFTPIFAIARIAGWSAHRIEEIVNAGKIIRPAYKSVAVRRDYIAIDER